MARIPIVYFSDVLCVWAYWAQLRIDEINRNFGDKILIEPRFCSIFGDTARKMDTAWGTKGGYDGFRAHLFEAAKGFPEAPLHPDIWGSARPASSLGPHLLLKAIQLAADAGEIAPAAFESAVTGMRRAFFEAARDIASVAVQHDIAAQAGADMAMVTRYLADGRAQAALASDYKDADALGVQGSPTFILDSGRQKLFGNVGYRIIEANIEELLAAPRPDQASWC
jgi:predicted DsbA family dithiol-disulfide isomerase